MTPDPTCADLRGPSIEPRAHAQAETGPSSSVDDRARGDVPRLRGRFCAIGGPLTWPLTAPSAIINC